ncbi:hypothetical protein [Nitratireductor luteus]|uniref:hypothetical protein n=1 Tax=Nitratireductor luteus TaxID=2976980 RepID=UPI00223FC7A2|nr:hypothetical protein [Nitratireductor luteus]
MSQPITSYLRKVLLLDAAVSGAAGVLMIAGAGILSSLLALPSGLLFWSGLVLVPFVAMLVAVARRPSAPRLVLIDIVGVNVLWVIASFAIMAVGIIQPNMLGVFFITVQALAVALFAALQAAGLRATAVPG